jgi:hypothetical protein
MLTFLFPCPIDLVNKSVVVETIDAKLTKDCEGDDDEEEYGGNEQTIQLKLDLGKVEDNPLIDLLSNDADNDNEEDACQKHLPEEEATEPQKAISKLLASSEEKSTASKKSKLSIEEM